MDMTLFSARSLWTMGHGIVLSGGALMGLGLALFGLFAMRPAAGERVSERQALSLSIVLIATTVALWLAVLVGTYIVFPEYRATPPADAASLAAYPRAMLLANPGTAWLHAYAMEIKEHVPWIAAMLPTAAAFVATRYRLTMLGDAPLRRATTGLVAIALVLSSFVGILGIFVNKVAPLE
jgi:hypothetical protein